MQDSRKEQRDYDSLNNNNSNREQNNYSNIANNSNLVLPVEPVQHHPLSSHAQSRTFPSFPNDNDNTKSNVKNHGKRVQISSFDNVFDQSTTRIDDIDDTILSSSSKRQRTHPLWNESYHHMNDVDHSDNTIPQQSLQLPFHYHRDFVSAIFDIGIKQSSPLHVYQKMSNEMKQKYPSVNAEKIKSKLQKYRKYTEKNKEEFMNFYDSTLEKLMTQSQHHQQHHVGMSGSKLEGEPAAHLTYAVMNECNNNIQRPQDHVFSNVPPTSSSFLENVVIPAAAATTTNITNTALQNNNHHQGGVGKNIEVPILSETEKKTPLGQALLHFFALSQSLTTELYRMRAEKEQQQQQQQSNHDFLSSNHNKTNHDNGSILTSHQSVNSIENMYQNLHDFMCSSPQVSYHSSTNIPRPQYPNQSYSSSIHPQPATTSNMISSASKEEINAAAFLATKSGSVVSNHSTKSDFNNNDDNNTD